jgi:hypothetical protein
MSFKVRDLMITVLPAGIPIAGVGDCLPTEQPHCTHCTDYGCTYCSGTRCTPNCTLSAKDFGDIVNPPELALLKERLKIALAEVEARERVVEESLRPKTLEDFELLEQKLNAALEDIRAQKAALGKNPSK